jgi:uncharacterized protein (TIRG00374 family)
MKNPQVWVGILISIISIGFLIWTVDFAELGAALADANPLLVLLCIATVPLSMYLKVYRWRLFFPDPGSVTSNGLLSALYLGYMANTVLPLRAGELVRAYLVGETERVSKSMVLATVLIEKVFDLGTIALLLVVLSFVMPLPEWASAAASASAVGLVVAAVCLGIALTARGFALRITNAIEDRLPPLRKLGISSLLASFLDGLSFVRNPRRLLWVIVWSSILWTGAASTVYIGLLALGVDKGIPVALLALAITNLGMAVPSAPGYVGVFHSAVVVALEPYGVPSHQALAAGIVLHAVVFGIFIVGGLVYLVRGQGAGSGKTSLGSLVARAQSDTGAAAH